MKLAIGVVLLAGRVAAAERREEGELLAKQGGYTVAIVGVWSVR